MNTKYITLLFFLFYSIILKAQDSELVTLEIHFKVTKYNRGVIYISLYDKADLFMKKSYKGQGLEVKDNMANFKFDGIKKGSYSFSYYHDVNSNKKLDKNFIGIPKEPYGFSNNQAGTFGPPSFEAAMFELTENKKLVLEIK